MFALSKDRNEALLALHGWSAVFLGLLLYWVILTGSLVVFADEINAWAFPVEQAEPGVLPANLDELLTEFHERVAPEDRDFTFLASGPGGLLRIFYEGHAPQDSSHTGDDPQQEPAEPTSAMGGEHTVQRLAFVNPNSGELVGELDLLAVEEGMEVPSNTPGAMVARGGLAEFFVDWHVNLHVPAPWGLLLTGILGLAMLVAAVTGLLIHRHLFRELFTLRRFKGGLLKERDSHVIAGTWSLPFAFVLAFTGSFFSLAGSFGIPAVAFVSFGGDQEKLVEELVGSPPELDPTPAPLSSLAEVIADVEQRFGLAVSDVGIFQAGYASAELQIGTFPPEDGLLRRVFIYDGVSGEFQREKPLIGDQASAGAAGLGLMGPLHFGNFGGVWSKLVWLSLGLAAAYVSYTGLTLFSRRRAEIRAYRILGQINTALGYGLPLGMATVTWAYFLGLRSGWHVEPLMMLVLLGTLVLALLWSFVRTQEQAARELRWTLALSLAVLPALRVYGGGPLWGEAWQMGAMWVCALDLLFVLTAIIMAAPGIFHGRLRPYSQRQHSLPTPDRAA